MKGGTSDIDRCYFIFQLFSLRNMAFYFLDISKSSIKILTAVKSSECITRWTHWKRYTFDIKSVHHSSNPPPTIHQQYKILSHPQQHRDHNNHNSQCKIGTPFTTSSKLSHSSTHRKHRIYHTKAQSCV